MSDQPTVGRIVHWYDESWNVPEAAIVIATHADSVDLNVFGSWTGESRLVVFAKPRTPSTSGWVWPPRH